MSEHWTSILFQRIYEQKHYNSLRTPFQEVLPLEIQRDILERLSDRDLEAYSCACRDAHSVAGKIVMAERARALYDDVIIRVHRLMNTIPVQLLRMQEHIRMQTTVFRSGLFEHGELRGCLNCVVCASVVPAETIGRCRITLRVARSWEKSIDNLEAYRRNILFSARQFTGVDFEIASI